jgi:hypothetical protein
MKMRGLEAFTVGFVVVAGLGGIAYWLEREQRRRFSSAVDTFFGPGGLSIPFLGSSAMPSVKPADGGPYTNPSKKV